MKSSPVTELPKTEKPPGFLDRKISIKAIALPAIAFVAAIVPAPTVNRWRVGAPLGGVSASGEQELQIEQVVREVKRQLEAAGKDRLVNNEATLFKLKDFEMEISFLVRHSERSGTEGKFEPIAVDNDLQLDSERTQRLKLHWDAATDVVKRVPPSKIPVVAGAPIHVDGSLPPPVKPEKGMSK